MGNLIFPCTFPQFFSLVFSLFTLSLCAMNVGLTHFGFGKLPRLVVGDNAYKRRIGSSLLFYCHPERSPPLHCGQLLMVPEKCIS